MTVLHKVINNVDNGETSDNVGDSESDVALDKATKVMKCLDKTCLLNYVSFW
jgi:hypothetical protein